ncbi:hypothetical protein B9Z19DRAFT_1153146 [Tuber borchii]|uniref:Uncharacterized protein n=1 Tax=Tuber borchii TaxID=42251 RepID=A0A2T6ZJB3_TUBBO|nr:hypothetical protein B9Z19DRAFT_1153146 [Tuber borchii]
MSKQTQKITPGDAFTPEESRTSSKLLLGYGRVSNVRTSSSNTTIGGGGGGGGGAGGSGGGGTVITISTAKGEDWKMHYPIHEPSLSFGSRVKVFGRVVNGWVSGGRVEITVDDEGGVEEEEEEVRIKEVIPLKAYSEVVGINTPHPTGTTNTTTTAAAAAAATMGILVCIKSVLMPSPLTLYPSPTNILMIQQTPRATTTTTGTPIPSLRIQILDATAEGTLTLWGPTATAATSAGWTPFSTALYITAARHLLKTYPHTRLHLLPPPEWPAAAAGMKLLFTLAEFSAHVWTWYYCLSGICSFWGLGSSNGKCSYTSTPNTHLRSLTDETGTIPGTALIFSQKAWDSLLLLTPTSELANKSLQELARLEAQLAYTRFDFAVVWDSEIGVLYVCDVSQ